MAHILSLATFAAPHAVPQAGLAKKIAKISLLNEAQSLWLERIYRHSAIDKRHSVLPEFQEEVGEWEFWNEGVPSTKARNEIYKREAPKLAEAACRQVIDEWGGDAASITHIIFVSCTGCVAPGIQSYLQQALGLAAHVNQLGINLMGCFGAFKGLDVASAFARLSPKNRILLVCTEICSIHFQQSSDPELQVGNALFADGAAACIVGIEPQAGEKPLWQIVKQASYQLPDTQQKMTWEISDSGFLMGLKADIPNHIEACAAHFIETLLPKELKFEDCLWPIHPGGKNILLAVERALKLTKEQTASSWHILKEYGNMSSPTFMFVLDHTKSLRETKAFSVGLGFGPGLMFEGIVLKNEAI